MDANDYTEISILGEPWKIYYKDEDPCFQVADGFCNECKREIIIQNIKMNPDEPTDLDMASKEINQKRVLRHEIVHAFLYESGLGESSFSTDVWAINEEMVDWFARQSPKIFKIYKDLKIL